MLVLTRDMSGPLKNISDTCSLLIEIWKCSLESLLFLSPYLIHWENDNFWQAKDKRKAFLDVCENFRFASNFHEWKCHDFFQYFDYSWPLKSLIWCRPVMHYFFLERFLQPADWFEKRLAYTRSVAASSMVSVFYYFY